MIFKLVATVDFEFRGQPINSPLPIFLRD